MIIRFIAVDIGSYGREGYAGIYIKYDMGKLITNNEFLLSAPAAIPRTSIILNHVLIGDEAFPLTETMMKPYPKSQSFYYTKKAIYNYRHSRARRTTENAYGLIYVSIFPCFFTPIFLRPEIIDKLITSACILHNMMRDSKIPFPDEQFPEQ